MNTIRSIVRLLASDFRALIAWWKSNALSKTIVLILFAGLFLLIALVIYAAGFTFLFPLTRYEVYGQLTALYLLHASLILTLWLGIASAFISSFNSLTALNAETDFLLTLPVRPLVIVIRSMIVSVITSFFWSLIVFFPLGIVILRLFGSGLNLNSYAHLSLIIFAVILFSTAAGNMLSFFFAQLLRVRNSAYLFILLGLTAFFVTFYLVKFLLPQDLGRLITATPVEFAAIFANLPLNRLYLPTIYLTRLLLGMWSPMTLWIIIVLILFVVIVVIYQSLYLIGLRQKLVTQMQPLVSRRLPLKYLFHHKIALAYKDLLSVILSPQEAGYGLFLLLLVILFFYFSSTQIKTNLLSYGLAWFFFYSIAYILRIIFPLMAKEGKTSWFLYTKSLSPLYIIAQKYLVSVVLALPLLIIAVFLWSWQTALLAAVSVLFLTLIGESVGNFFPNFSESNNPEKISTSMTGIFACGILLGLSYLIVKQYSLLTTMPLFAFTLLISLGLFVILLIDLSILAVRRYRF